MIDGMTDGIIASVALGGVIVATMMALCEYVHNVLKKGGKRG